MSLIYLSCHTLSGLLCTAVAIACILIGLTNEGWTVVETSEYETESQSYAKVSFAPFGYCIETASNITKQQCFKYHLIGGGAAFTAEARLERKKRRNAWAAIGYSEESWCAQDFNSHFAYLFGGSQFWCLMLNSMSYMFFLVTGFCCTVAFMMILSAICFKGDVERKLESAAGALTFAFAMLTMTLGTWMVYQSKYIHLRISNPHRYGVVTSKTDGDAMYLMLVAVIFMCFGFVCCQQNKRVRTSKAVGNSNKDEEQPDPLQCPPSYVV